MKTEDIIRMARQAADELPGYTSKVKDPSGAALKFYKKFAAIVAAAEREAVLQTIEALYDTQDPNPMYKEGYNHALDNIEEFIKGRANATLS